jgi:malate dehydrogenase (oxaloacetate-decarboxylating)
MTDKMIVAGSNRLSELAPALHDPKKALLPEFGGALHLCYHVQVVRLMLDAASVNFEIALAVLEQAIEEGVAQAEGIPDSEGERRKWAEEKRWIPEYQQYQYDPAGRK